ncbi:MAG TPA: merozoite surface protein 3b [Noviherbaspirillum sp.]
MLPVNYLDRAVSALRRLGIDMQTEQGAPVVAILEKIARYDNAKVASIASTLQQSSSFNAAVREQIAGMDISTRYADIAGRFNSIRDDAQQMAGWMADGKLDFKERLQQNWMRLRRGSIPDRFNDIRTTYHEVARSANDQIQREDTILEAYRDFRMALKAAEVQAQELLNTATAALEEKKSALQIANAAVEGYTGQDVAERTRLELARDEALRNVQNEDKSFQIVKDIADDLKTAYNAAELVFARLQQTHNVKERLYQRAVTFFSTNEVVFTGLSASFTSMAGLSEATNTMEAMKAGMNKGLEDLAQVGGAQLEAGLRAGYGSTLQASSVKALANAVVEFQTQTIKLVEELRKESTQTAKEIEDVTEDSKRRFVELVNKGA